MGCWGSADRRVQALEGTFHAMERMFRANRRHQRAGATVRSTEFRSTASQATSIEAPLAMEVKSLLHFRTKSVSAALEKELDVELLSPSSESGTRRPHLQTSRRRHWTDLRLPGDQAVDSP